jgi:hypothetical protein
LFRGGLAKIIPPKEWIPRRSGYNLRTEKDLANMNIPAPISQVSCTHYEILETIETKLNIVRIRILIL